MRKTRYACAVLFMALAMFSFGGAGQAAVAAPSPTGSLYGHSTPAGGGGEVALTVHCC